MSWATTTMSVFYSKLWIEVKWTYLRTFCPQGTMKRVDRAPVKDTAIPTHPNLASKKANVKTDPETMIRWVTWYIRVFFFCQWHCRCICNCICLLSYFFPQEEPSKKSQRVSRSIWDYEHVYKVVYLFILNVFMSQALSEIWPPKWCKGTKSSFAGSEWRFAETDFRVEGKVS